MAQIFEQEKNHVSSESIFERALKKYKYSKKVWSAYQLYCLRQHKIDQAKQLLTRSLQSLSKHKHVQVITWFACAEYDFGSVDRARVLFEELLASYPKRLDLWHVYIDKEIKAKHGANYLDYVRTLFDRLVHSKQKPKQMQTVFKKYLEFEVKNGNQTTQAHVKTKAKEYVENIMNV
jgi:rRNA biogenesis protein RRP5